MCGPILLGFSQVFQQDGVKRSLRRDFACYHAGRIWTYAVLGFIAGLLGSSLRHGSAALGWQQWAAVILSGAVVLTGVALLGLVPGFKVEQAVSCGVKRFGKQAWFSALMHGRGAAPRLLLGAVMGLLPCGLVYAMLVIVAALPTPWHAALGMIVFGFGTLPSLSLVIGTSSLLQVGLGRSRSGTWLRGHGTHMAAVMLILTGGWMMARTLLPHRHGDHADHAAHSVPSEPTDSDAHAHHSHE
jgi:sulfite exporter TauE/SafE